ncbi:hypothetical protein ELQ92_13525 [Labedella populi]|uniref:Type IV toxin-antitoxin system AbiEi family antitoxin domain-containing protein n=1 Tax=Labedella populi TaxID=2498850 RepID=A0A3S3ZKZ5_9MICO|nr:hypothetical protein [Labedella populi]RWZ59274.1 hypothetical protein ELQ92_13525 [Labedella populi]
MSDRSSLQGLPLISSKDHRSLGRQRRPSDADGERRIRRGVYVASEQWDRADDAARYVSRIRAVAATRMTDIVFSHQSAAVLLGLPLLGGSPLAVHATTSPASRRRSRAGVMWHHVRLEGGEAVGEFDGRIKYSRNRLPGEASVEDVVWAEKRREDDLRAAQSEVVRWTWQDALDGTSLITALARHGIAASAPHRSLPVFTKGKS